jgi:hypothetical protein
VSRHQLHGVVAVTLDEMIQRATAHRDKTAGSRLREMLKVIPMADGSGFQVSLGDPTTAPEFTRLIPQGKNLSNHMRMKDFSHVSGTMTPEGFRIGVTGGIPEQLRNMGLGRKIYGEMARQSPNRTILSDKLVSDKAQRVYGSMARDPHYAVTKAPSVPLPRHGASLSTNMLPPRDLPGIFSAKLNGTFKSPAPALAGAAPPAQPSMFSRIGGFAKKLLTKRV